MSGSALRILQEEALKNAKGNARLLVHGDPSRTLHEMVISHRRGLYIRPHINGRSAKSYVVLDGEMTVVWFSPEGKIAGHAAMGATGEGSLRMLRFDGPVFHTLIPTSETVTFVETILGPHEETTYSEWSPSPEAREACAYYENLKIELKLQQ